MASYDELGNVAVFEKALKTGGKFYVDLNRDGNYSYIFESHNATLTPTVETIEIPDTESCIQSIGATATKLMKIEGALESYTYSPDVVALAFAGVTDVTGDAAATAEAVTLTAVKQGTYRKIGYVGITDLVVEDVTDTTTYVLDTDYTLDAKTGLIGIIVGGGIDDDDDLHLTVTSPINTNPVVQLLQNETDEVGLMFVGCPTTGDRIEFELFRVKMIANGAVNLKGEEFTPIGISFTALSDSSKGVDESKYGTYRVLPA